MAAHEGETHGAGRHRAGRRRPATRSRVTRPIKVVAGLMVAIGLAGALPVAAAQAAPPTSQVQAAPGALPMPAPEPCPGCFVYVINVPIEPTDMDFGNDPNTTVDLRVELPPTWGSVICGDEFGVSARDAGDGDGLAVARWRCRSDDNELHYSGPASKDINGAPVRFLFQGNPPPVAGPPDPLIAPFIDLTQTYVDGEQHRRRAAKMFQVSRVGTNENDATLRLPPRWIAPLCGLPSNPAGDKVYHWNCQLDPGTGTEPNFKIKWEYGGDPGDGAARDFYFHAFTKDQPIVTAPLNIGPGVTTLTDVQFDDGQIPTSILKHLRPGFRKPKATPSADATVTVQPSYRGHRPGDCTPYFVSDTDSAAIRPEVRETLSTTTELDLDDASVSVTERLAPSRRDPNDPFYNGGNISVTDEQWAVAPGCVKPNLIVDPCAGAFFGKYGHGRFGPRREDVPSACYGPFGDRRERPGGPEPIALNRRNERCIPTRNNMGRPLPPGEYDRMYGAQAAPPAQPMPPQTQPEMAPPGPGYGPSGPNGAFPDRADRSYHRVPLKPAADPNDPPVLLVSPEDGTGVQRVPGSNDDRVIVAPPNANPRPSIRALLPESRQGGSYVEPEQPPLDMPQAMPFCEEDLPRTGSNSTPVLKMAVGVLGIGVALVMGAVYFRRNAPDHSWYSGGA